jgi:hypothetical protein
MGTYFKALNDNDEAILLYNQVKILLGFICVVISSEYLYFFITGAGRGVLYMADLLALLVGRLHPHQRGAPAHAEARRAIRVLAKPRQSSTF